MTLKSAGDDTRHQVFSSNYALLVLYYVVFGAIHELSHVAVAIWLYGSDAVLRPTGPQGDSDDSLLGVVPFLYRTLVGRQSVVQTTSSLTKVCPGGIFFCDKGISGEELIRHTGWIVSILVLFMLVSYHGYSICQCNGLGNLTSRSRINARLFAAALTAVEALCTDLFQLQRIGVSVIPGVLLPPSSTLGSSSCMVFFCGNFGIILLHHAWLTSDNGSRALDVLEKMVQVTMMRGAQSGGVITYDKDRRGIRTRVVNKKRTDLSKLVRRGVQRDVFGSNPISSAWNTWKMSSSSFEPKAFCGHTRFATSSKATLEGTHPQQWSPVAYRRVYELTRVPHDSTTTPDSQSSTNLSSARRGDYTPRLCRVENYVTHNGDFDFYIVNGTTYDLGIIFQWLETVTGCKMPATVDSAAVAGIVDILRTQGCFGLSARYAVCLGLQSSKMEAGITNFPSYGFFEEVGLVFEEVLETMLKTSSFDAIEDSSEVRHSFALRVASKLKAKGKGFLEPICRYVSTEIGEEVDEEEGANREKALSSVLELCKVTIDAFFDNDLFMTTKTFLKNAKGSFGLCINSSLDAHRQICLAARGQTMSIAFYPSKGIICYGSEQAAVKAGLSYGFPGDEDSLGRSRGDVDNDALRLDLDDLGGEIICLDWGSSMYKSPAVSRPNRGLVQHELMNGFVEAVIYQESKATTQDPQIYHRMTRLSRNRFIKPLQKEPEDLVLKDIRDIPKICRSIQDEWKSDCASSSLNRLTAYNLSRSLRKRLEAHVAGEVHPRAIDILLTGCEVSLWLAEQFASDLQKSFPALRIQAVSSNKLLGLFGQEIAVPTLGFPYGPKTHYLNDAIVIIVSHSGGTFAPLSCSNLLQSATRNIFVVTSEWDTQISKQLRAMDNLDDQEEDHLFHSRIFSTEVGMRPAEPCSVSVVATHQLLTNLFEYICVLILSDPRYRTAAAAVISEEDLLVLERCNQANIEALTEIVGANRFGYALDDNVKRVEMDLRKAGDQWAEHILENAKAYIITFMYIFATVVSGYPFFYAIAYGAGLNKSNDWIYLISILDAAIYFWLPQINITLLRLIQGRNIRHRMVGRTVVIGDIPWVAQAADAFLSKIFACSYSIAGLNVLSGNPSDHFVHRHTHRVVRGSLIICGRPDGRLSALSTAEAAVCLSVNQASSIQSIGGTCESITIGHNPFKLPLSERGIFLKRKRPLFLCERLLVENDVKEENKSPQEDPESSIQGADKRSSFARTLTKKASSFFETRKGPDFLDLSLSRHRDTSVQPRIQKRRSAAALIGAYMNFEDETEHTECEENPEGELSVDKIIAEAIQERKWSDKARKLFKALDLDENGFLSEEEFILGSYRLKPGLTEDQAKALFQLADRDKSGHVDFNEFLELLQISDLDRGIKLPPSNRNERGIIQITPSRERYFGETLRKYNAGKSRKDVDFKLARSQHFSQELYETRIASLQRFVSMTVMFHQMGKRVQEFFPKISFGLLGYRMDRTHSIMRIATTASPISGSDVRQRMRQLQLLKKVQHSIHVISVAYLRYKGRKESERVQELERKASSGISED